MRCTDLGIVYLIGNLRHSGRVKIGWTSSVPDRLHDLAAGALGFDLRIYAAIVGDKINEQLLHTRFSEYAIGREWFRLSPAIKRWAESESDWMFKPGASGKIPCLVSETQAEMIFERYGFEGHLVGNMIRAKQLRAFNLAADIENDRPDYRIDLTELAEAMRNRFVWN